MRYTVYVCVYIYIIVVYILWYSDLIINSTEIQPTFMLDVPRYARLDLGGTRLFTGMI